jgi:5-methylthioadenosine/S-adenosylhomocysteine deaminase
MTMPEKATIDTLIHAAFIVPVVPSHTVLQDHCIAIRNGKIVEILPQAEGRKRYSAETQIELSEHVLLPGLINAHGHAAMTLFRGLADDLPLMEWLNDHIWPAEGKWVSADFVYDGTRLAIAEMLRSGTSCFSDMYFFPEMAARAAKEMGIRAQLSCPILDFPTVWGSGPDEYIRKTMELHRQYQSDDLIHIALGPHAPYTVSNEPLSRIRELALEHKMNIQIHLHETQFEVDEAIRDQGIRPIQRMANIGLLNEDIALQCVHMTTLNDEDIAQLVNSNAQVIHCPESNLKLASGFCETDKLIKAGINVALGTDGAASNNDLDMFGEMRTAALIAKAVAKNAAAVDAMTAIEMATINGAKALGLAALTGSLETGKSADLIALQLNQLNSQPSYHLLSDLVYAINSRQVTDHWIQGKHLLQTGKLAEGLEQDILTKAKQWARKIQDT